MIKKVGFWSIVIFSCTLTQSCSKVHEPCDAYTKAEKMKKINAIKSMASSPTEIVHN